MSTKAVAKRLGVSDRTIARWLNAGYFPNAYKLNPETYKSAYIIPEVDVIAFEQKRLNSLPRDK